MGKQDGQILAIQFNRELSSDGANEAYKYCELTWEARTAPDLGEPIVHKRTAISSELDPTDSTILYVNYGAGNQNSFQNAAHQVCSLLYFGDCLQDSSGNKVMHFNKTFTPEDLAPKNNQHMLEQVESYINAPVINYDIIPVIEHTAQHESEYVRGNVVVISVSHIITNVGDM